MRDLESGKPGNAAPVGHRPAEATTGKTGENIHKTRNTVLSERPARGRPPPQPFCIPHCLREKISKLPPSWSVCAALCYLYFVYAVLAVLVAALIFAVAFIIQLNYVLGDDPRRLAPLLPMPGNHTDFLDCGRTYVGESTTAKAFSSNSAKFESQPWQAAIGYFNSFYPIWNRGEYPLLCSGSLINERYVLTTASCVADRWFVSDIIVRLGEYDYGRKDEVFKHVDYAIDRIIIHEEYNMKRINDIALLRLSEPVIFRENIAPVCLQKDDDIRTDEKVFHSGWATEVGEDHDHHRLTPSKIEVELVDRDLCRQDIDEVRQTPDLFLATNFLCSVPVSYVERTCSGDSGSPLFLKRDGRAQLIGIYSFGQSCLAKDPAVYTRVSSYFDWISRKMRIYQPIK